MPVNSISSSSYTSGFGSGMLSRGSRGAAVSDLQQQLAAAGFDPGPIDGDFGPLTEEAVRAFQSARGLQVDGIAGPQTFGALGAEARSDGGGSGSAGPHPTL